MFVWGTIYGNDNGLLVWKLSVFRKQVLSPLLRERSWEQMWVCKAAQGLASQEVLIPCGGYIPSRTEGLWIDFAGCPLQKRWPGILTGAARLPVSVSMDVCADSLRREADECGRPRAVGSWQWAVGTEASPWKLGAVTHTEGVGQESRDGWVLEELWSQEY